MQQLLNLNKEYKEKNKNKKKLRNTLILTCTTQNKQHQKRPKFKNNLSLPNKMSHKKLNKQHSQKKTLINNHIKIYTSKMIRNRSINLMMKKIGITITIITLLNRKIQINNHQK